MVPFNDVASGELGDSLENLLYVAIRAGEDDKLLTIDDEGVLTALSDEPLEEKPSLHEEFELIPPDCLLGRESRKVDARPSLDKDLIKEVEVVISSCPLPGTLPVYSLNEVLDVATLLLRVSHLEFSVHVLFNDIDTLWHCLLSYFLSFFRFLLEQIALVIVYSTSSCGF